MGDANALYHSQNGDHGVSGCHFTHAHPFVFLFSHFFLGGPASRPRTYSTDNCHYYYFDTKFVHTLLVPFVEHFNFNLMKRHYAALLRTRIYFILSLHLASIPFPTSFFRSPFCITFYFILSQLSSSRMPLPHRGWRALITTIWHESKMMLECRKNLILSI